jgi:outer membrane protein
MKTIALSRAPAFAALGALAFLVATARPALPDASAEGSATALSLAQAVAAAGQETPAVKLAELRWDEAKSRRHQARSVFLPSVGGSAAFVRQTLNEEAFGISIPSAPGVTPDPLIGPFNLWDARGEASQVLFSPSSWLQVRAASEDVTTKQAEMGTSRQDAATAAAEAYVAACQAQATLGARRREQALAEQLQAISQQQLKAGMATRLDLVRAESQVASARSGIALAQYASTRAQIDLARALGRSPVQRFDLVDTLSISLGSLPELEAREGALAMAMKERLELAAARARYAAGQTAARSISAERLGMLRLVGNYGYNGIAPDDWIRTGLVSVQYSVPFFEGGRQEGRRREQLARAEEASVQLRDLQDRIVAEVTNALEALEAGKARQSIATDQLRLAEEEVREARALFEQGLAGNIEAIQAQAELEKAHTTMIDALAQTALARVRLARAAGIVLTLQ